MDGAWWSREDQLRVRSNDENYGSTVQLKRSWAHISKEKLNMPILAPRFPNTPGSKEDWDALLKYVVDLYNDGKLPDFISYGSRKNWPSPSNVFPTLKILRDLNWEGIKGE